MKVLATKTVAELIEALQRLPQDAIAVRASDSEETGKVWLYSPVATAGLTLAHSEGSRFKHSHGEAGARKVVVLR